MKALPHYDIIVCTMKEQPFYQEHIVTDPRILAGKPVVKGTRIAVDLVLEELSHNPDVNELLAAHPDLSVMTCRHALHTQRIF